MCVHREHRTGNCRVCRQLEAMNAEAPRTSALGGYAPGGHVEPEQVDA